MWRIRGWVIRLVCSGHCTSSTRCGWVHSLSWGVATRLFRKYFRISCYYYYRHSQWIATQLFPYISRLYKMMLSGDQWRLWLYVCACVHPLKGKRIELSTPNLVVYTYTLWQSLTTYWPRGQKVKGQGHLVTIRSAPLFTAGMGLHVVGLYTTATVSSCTGL